MAHTLDIILAVILILRALRGWTRGAISGIASLIGLIGGVWVGLWASGDIVSRITNNSSSWLATGPLRFGVVLVPVVGLGVASTCSCPYGSRRYHETRSGHGVRTRGWFGVRGVQCA